MGFAGGLGYLIWGEVGLLFLLAFTLSAVLFNPTISPWLVMTMYRAIGLPVSQAPSLHYNVALMAKVAGLPNPPQLYLIPSQVLNAFAVGKQSNSAIAVTYGMLNRLTEEELLAVLAHEISHIRNNDIRVMGLADLFSRMTSFLSLLGQALFILNLPLMLYAEVAVNWATVAVLILAPTISALAQLALSRTREYEADLLAVKLTGNPDGLARALAKIEYFQGGWLEQIVLPGRRLPDPSLLRTHPPTQERIKRLLAVKKDLYPSYASPAFKAPHFNGWVPKHKPKAKPRWHINGLWY